MNAKTDRASLPRRSLQLDGVTSGLRVAMLRFAALEVVGLTRLGEAAG